MFGKILSVVTLFSCIAVSGAENLVPNADFNTLEKWSINSRPVSIKTFSVKDGILFGQFADGIKQKDFVAATTSLPKLEVASVYVFGAKIRINAVAKAKKKVQIAIREVGANGRTVGYQNIFPLLTKSGQYLEVSKTFTARKNAASHQFYIVMSNFEPGDTLEVDNVFVRKAEPPVAVAGNPVRNGDFEAGLAGWNYATDRDVASTSIAFDAEKGKVLRLTGDPANRFNNFKTVINDLGKLPAGKYTLSFDAAAKAVPAKNKAFYVRVREVNEKGRSIRYAGTVVNISKAGWQKYAAAITLSGKAAGCQLFISIQNFAADDEIMLDNITLAKK